MAKHPNADNVPRHITLDCGLEHPDTVRSTYHVSHVRWDYGARPDNVLRSQKRAHETIKILMWRTNLGPVQLLVQRSGRPAREFRRHREPKQLLLSAIRIGILLVPPSPGEEEPIGGRGPVVGDDSVRASVIAVRVTAQRGVPQRSSTATIQKRSDEEVEAGDRVIMLSAPSQQAGR
jgi:hypothetical protein